MAGARHPHGFPSQRQCGPAQFRRLLGTRVLPQGIQGRVVVKNLDHRLRLRDRPAWEHHEA